MSTEQSTRERPAAPGDADAKGDLKLVQYQVQQLDKKFDRLSDDLENQYATKAELGEVRDDVKGLRENIGWAIKIVLGAVLVAVVNLVIVKGGVPHP